MLQLLFACAPSQQAAPASSEPQGQQATTRTLGDGGQGDLHLRDLDGDGWADIHFQSTDCANWWVPGSADGFGEEQSPGALADCGATQLDQRFGTLAFEDTCTDDPGPGTEFVRVAGFWTEPAAR
jgi:hypothetical protein